MLTVSLSNMRYLEWEVARTKVLNRYFLTPRKEMGHSSYDTLNLPLLVRPWLYIIFMSHPSNLLYLEKLTGSSLRSLALLQHRRWRSWPAQYDPSTHKTPWRYWINMLYASWIWRHREKLYALPVWRSSPIRLNSSLLLYVFRTNSTVTRYYENVLQHLLNSCWKIRAQSKYHWIARWKLDKVLFLLIV